MREPFKRILGAFVFMLSLSIIHWSGDSLSFKPGTAEAKIIQAIGDTGQETVILDKNNPGIRKAIEVQNRHTAKLMAKADVVGTATGLTDDNVPAILVFTKKILPAEAIPQSLEGVPVVVKFTGEILTMKKVDSGQGGGTRIDPTAKLRPARIGISTGNADECSAGTVGARVKDINQNVYALSNNHVYALENTADAGSEILQPGLYDTHCKYNSTDVIGTLYNYVPISFNNTCNPDTKSGCNIVDAASAQINIDPSTGKPFLLSSTPDNGYGTPNSTTYLNSSPEASLYVGLPVQKYGRTTSLTKGAVSGLNAVVTVSYGPGKNAIFADQIIIGSSTPFLKAGDSGSLVVTDDAGAYPVGLLFAGSSSGKYAIANPIDPVLSALGMTIDNRE